MARFSYVTDPFSGKTTGILIDINVWNQYLTFHPDAMHAIVGNTFENSTYYGPDSIFGPEPKRGIVPDDFQGDISKMKN